MMALKKKKDCHENSFLTNIEEQKLFLGSKEMFHFYSITDAIHKMFRNCREAQQESL
jgi:hypothetical protein